MIPSRWFGHASLDLSVLTPKPRIANEFLLLCLKLTCGHCRTTCIGPNLALLSRADEEIGWESQLAISFITLVYLGDKFSKSAQGYFRFFLTYFELNSLTEGASGWPTRCHHELLNMVTKIPSSDLLLVRFIMTCLAAHWAASLGRYAICPKNDPFFKHFSNVSPTPHEWLGPALNISMKGYL